MTRKTMSDDQPALVVDNVVKMGVIMLPLGIYLFQRAEKYTERTGKLKRNG